jgi:septum formation protein
MFSHLRDRQFILASKSPRRKALLEELGLKFETRTKDIDEKFPPALQREEIPRYLSRLKASAFKDELSDREILITSDTIVWFENKVLEKPSDRNEAIDMISTLSGSVHEVVSAITVSDPNKSETAHSITRVSFIELSKKEIEFYVDHYKPYDKAGAYGIQEWIGLIGVDRIEGSYFNVVGLPVHELYRLLKNWD